MGKCMIVIVADAVKQAPIKPVIQPIPAATGKVGEEEIKTEDERGGEGEEEKEGGLGDYNIAADNTGEEDEEDIEIVLGGVPTTTTNNAITANGGAPSNKSGITKSAVDIQAVGQLNGISILETDLESFEDRPWRKPGADITDYFNYGFTETTWRQYCMKQRNVREENRQTASGGAASGLGMPPGMPPMPHGLPFPPMMPPPFMFRPPVPGATNTLPPPPLHAIPSEKIKASPAKNDFSKPGRSRSRSGSRSRSRSRDHDNEWDHDRERDREKEKEKERERDKSRSRSNSKSRARRDSPSKDRRRRYEGREGRARESRSRRRA